MVKIVDMTSALKQVREGKLNEISPDMRKFELEKQYKMILKDMPASEKNTEAGKIRAMDLARVTATRAPGMTMKDLKILQKNKGTLKLEDDAYDNDRFIVKGGAVKKDNSNTPDSKDHVYAPNAKIAKQLHSQGKKVYREDLDEGYKTVGNEKGTEFKVFKDGKLIKTFSTYIQAHDYVKQQKEDLDKDDVKTIKPIIKQLQKSVKSHDKQAKQLTKDISDEKDLEEQAKELEEQLKTAEKELEELYIKEDKAYVIRFKRIKDKERMVVVFRNQNDADMYADNIKKQGGQVFSNKLEKIPYKVVDKK